MRLPCKKVQHAGLLKQPMIIKQIKGTSFNNLLDYLLSKSGAVRIAGNLDGQTPQQLGQELSFINCLNRRVKRPVYHVSFSLAPSEQLTNEDWSAIAQRYLEEMGFTQNQYIVVRHSDRDHEHVHLVANRIRLDGSCVHDGWDYRRSEQIARQIEQDYGLVSPISSWEKDRRSPSTGEWRLTNQTEQQSARSRIQQAIDAATQTECTLAELIKHLQQQDISVKINWTRTGKNKGISYQWCDYHFSGTQLGRAYTFMGLQNYRGVDYLDERDQFELHNLLSQQPAEFEPEEQDAQLMELSSTPIEITQPSITLNQCEKPIPVPRIHSLEASTSANSEAESSPQFDLD